MTQSNQNINTRRIRTQSLLRYVLHILYRTLRTRNVVSITVELHWKHKYWFHWSFLLFAVFALFYFLIFSKKKNEPWFHLSFPLFGHFCSILFISTLIFITSFLLLLWCLGSVCSSLSSFFSYKDRLFIWDFCCCCFLRQACINISTLYMILLFTIFQCSMDLK